MLCNFWQNFTPFCGKLIFFKRILATQQKLINASTDQSILTQTTQAHTNLVNFNTQVDIKSTQMNTVSIEFNLIVLSHVTKFRQNFEMPT